MICRLAIFNPVHAAVALKPEWFKAVAEILAGAVAKAGAIGVSHILDATSRWTVGAGQNLGSKSPAADI